MREPEAARLVLSWLETHASAGTVELIAIDGRCAAGKTTLAHWLGSALSCGVLHMDDFFLRPEQRTASRLAAPGGNVDYERFLTSVLKPLSRGEAFSYQPYDCHLQTLLPPVPIAPGPRMIVEGSYSCHPALWDYYTCRVFLTVSGAEQRRRISGRNGPDGLRVFLEKWIQLEERYFASLAERPAEEALWIDSEGRLITKEQFILNGETR